LRLTPAYYLCIAVAAALNIAQMRQGWWINVLYLTNFQVAANGAWNGYSHFWTLSVEEQFYLLWFAAVMFLPRKVLLVIAIACFYLAPLYRWVGDNRDMWWYGHLMLPAAMDSLAAGALLAYATRFSTETELWRKFVRVRGAVFWVSLAAMVVLMYEGIFSYTLTNVFAVCLVSLAVAKASDWRVDWLGAKTLRHFGKISYGIYVFHLFVPQVMYAHWHFHWTIGDHVTPLVLFIVFTVISVAIAEISWWLIERPLASFKDWLTGEDLAVATESLPMARAHQQAGCKSAVLICSEPPKSSSSVRERCPTIGL
jgi:peptidoglycan/LPS O-acetylase OafA/YrhL